MFSGARCNSLLRQAEVKATLKDRAKDLFLMPFLSGSALTLLWLGNTGAACSASYSVSPNWTELLATGDRNMAIQELVKSEECYRQALRQVKRVPHSKDELAQCREKLAATLLAENKTDEALPLYKKSLRSLQKAVGDESRQILSVLYALGSIYEAEGDLKPALKQYRRALAISEKNFGPLSLEVATSLHCLARANASAHFGQEAEGQYMLALSIMMRQASLPSAANLESLLSDYVQLLNNLDIPTKLLVSDFQTMMLKDPISALNLNMGVPPSNWQKQVSAQLAGKDASELVDGTNKNYPDLPLRGLTEPSEKQNPESVVPPIVPDKLPASGANGKEFYERMIAIDIKALGANHPTVANDLTALASVYVAQHRFAEAYPLLTRALSIYEKIYDKENLLVTRTNASLAYLSKSAQTPQSLLPNYFDTSTLAKIPPQAKTLEVARRLNDLSFICYCQNKLENAEIIYRWAFAATAGATGNQSIVSAACLNDFAKVLRSLGQTKEAHQMQATASAILTGNALSQKIRLD
jgi:tetratricopeptide (TPR) repeat protein